MGFDPDRTIMALTKRARRMPLIQREAGVTVALALGRKSPLSQQAVQDAERKAMAKIRAVLEKRMGGT